MKRVCRPCEIGMGEAKESLSIANAYYVKESLYPLLFTVAD